MKLFICKEYYSILYNNTMSKYNLASCKFIYIILKLLIFKNLWTVRILFSLDNNNKFLNIFIIFII